MSAGGASGTASKLQQGAAVASLFGPIGIGIGAVLSVASLASARDAERHMRRAQQLRSSITNMSNFEARREFMRNFRQTQAIELTRGASMGLDSSASQGTLASLETQRADAISRRNQKEDLDRRARRQERKAGAASSQSSTLGAIGSVAGSVGSSLDDIREFS